MRAFLAAQGTEAVVSQRPSRPATPPYDARTYRARNLVKRAFCRLKDWRAIVARYDKTARNFLAGICLGIAVTQWIRCVHVLVERIQVESLKV